MSRIAITPTSAGRIRRTVETVEGQGRHGTARNETLPGIIEICWVQITSTTQTDNRYPGSLYRRNANAGTFTLEGSAGSIWVDTPNGESLSTGTYYPARIAGNKTSDSKAIYDVFGRFGLTAITVEESDGTPSYTDVTVLEFDQASKFKVTQPSAGRAKVEIEGLTSNETIVTAVSCNSGTLSVTTKTFAFTDGILQTVT